VTVTSRFAVPVTAAVKVVSGYSDNAADVTGGATTIRRDALSAEDADR